MKCYICNKELKSNRALSGHIKTEHKDINTEEYYIKYISKGEHLCPVCGKQNKFLSLSKGFTMFCSNGCKSSNDGKELININKIKTSLKKYGVEHYSKTDESKKQHKETSLEKYGVDNYSKTDECKEKVKETSLEKYGVDNYSKTDESKKQHKETFLEKYGVDNYSKTNESKEKVKDTCLEKYGVPHYSKTDEFKEKTKKTCIEKYGVDHYNKTDEYKEKSGITRRDNYWNTYKLLLKNKKIEVLFNKEYFLKNDIFNFKCLKCGKEFSINEYKNIQNIYCKSCNKSISNEEVEVLNYIKSIYKGNIESNKRFYLSEEDKKKYKKSSLEADILIEEHKLIIEYDGVYWHSEIYKEKYYHINKTDYFNSIGYNVIHIFSTEWNDKEDIVKSIIKNKLGLNSNRIYARKCVIKEVSSKDYNLFIEDNHIQGSINSKYRLGLYYENELVSVIGIGKSRFTSYYELYRMVNKKGYSIVGGFSKLIKNFFKLYDINKIETYCDRRYFNGNGYEKVGFKFDSYTKPAYYYMDKSYKVLYNRFKFMKYKLKDELKIFDSNKTEHENMLLNNYNRIYDCGNIKYIMEKI